MFNDRFDIRQKWRAVKNALFRSKDKRRRAVRPDWTSDALLAPLNIELDKLFEIVDYVVTLAKASLDLPQTNAVRRFADHSGIAYQHLCDTEEFISLARTLTEIRHLSPAGPTDWPKTKKWFLTHGQLHDDVGLLLELLKDHDRSRPLHQAWILYVELTERNGCPFPMFSLQDEILAMFDQYQKINIGMKILTTTLSRQPACSFRSSLHP